MDRRRSPGLRSGPHADPGLSRHRSSGTESRFRSGQSTAPQQSDANVVSLALAHSWRTQSKSNPSPTPEFPANREINRELCRNRPLDAILIADTRANSETCSEIPCATEQGIFAKEQGICAREQ